MKFSNLHENLLLGHEIGKWESNENFEALTNFEDPKISSGLMFPCPAAEGTDLDHLYGYHRPLTAVRAPVPVHLRQKLVQARRRRRSRKRWSRASLT